MDALDYIHQVNYPLYSSAIDELWEQYDIIEKEEK